MLDHKHIIVLGTGLTSYSYVRWLKAHIKWTTLQLVTQGKDPSFYDLHVKGISQPFSIVDTLSECVLYPRTILLVPPGWSMYHNADFLEQVVACDGKVMTDFDLFFQAPATRHKPLIGVTGTNGKSTVVDLMSYIFQDTGMNIAVGGNIGIPVLDLLSTPADGYLLEVSSFQLEQMKKPAFTHGVILNITTDHLDYHMNQERYIKAKVRLADANVVYVREDDLTHFAHIKGFEKKVHIIKAPKNLSTTLSVDPSSKRSVKPSTHLATEMQQITHPLNEAFARKVAQDLGCSMRTINKGCATYKRLPHRQQVVQKWVQKMWTIWFVDDSKATNVAAAREALKNFQNIYWIVGGILKEKEIHLSAQDLQNVRGIWCFGQDGPHLFQILSHPCLYVHTTLVEAITHAYQTAIQTHTKESVCTHKNASLQEEAPSVSYKTILLSPMCASFDQFQGFQHRGRIFQQCAMSLSPHSAKKEVLSEGDLT